MCDNSDTCAEIELNQLVLVFFRTSLCDTEYNHGDFTGTQVLLRAESACVSYTKKVKGEYPTLFYAPPRDNSDTCDNSDPSAKIVFIHLALVVS